MASNVTRISDLPENITLAPMISNKKEGVMQNTTYQTIDPHPNPYCHPPPSGPSFPASTLQGAASCGMPSFGKGTGTGGMGGGQVPQMPIQPVQTQYLPPRDMPKDQIQYTNDEQIQPNYIPPIPQEKVNTTNEFMRKYEEEKYKELKTHDEKKKKKSKKDEIVEQSQVPIFVAVLFFLFNMPLINRMIFKRLAFLNIYDTEGQMNTYGLFLKSASFGLIYYLSSCVIDWLSEI
jgi:hypothetical protein